MQISLCFIVGTLATTVTAHMQLVYPAPFNASNNPHLTTSPDHTFNTRTTAVGQAPAGHTHAAGTNLSLANLANWSISGIGNHYGGSCQVGFSIDKGETFKVATSYEGNCPNRNAGTDPAGQTFPFIVPTDMKPGVHLFTWTWYNREQEFNMNCAAVNITAAEGISPQPTTSIQAYTTVQTTTSASTATSRAPDRPLPVYKTANDCTCTCQDPVIITTCTCICSQRTPNTSKRAIQAFDSRPNMFVADVGNGCKTPKTSAELKFPNPGLEVVTGDGEYELRLPSGNCGSGGL